LGNPMALILRAGARLETGAGGVYLQKEKIEIESLALKIGVLLSIRAKGNITRQNFNITAKKNYRGEQRANRARKGETGGKTL